MTDLRVAASGWQRPGPPVRALVVLGVLIALAVLALYPALFALPDHVPTVAGGGVSDYYHFHWNYAWIRHALSNGLAVYSTDAVMAPFTSSLVLHTLTPFWFPLWALLEPLAGTAAAMDAILIASMAFAGLTTFALLRAEGAPRGLALAGGAMFELSAIFMVGIQWTNINLMGWGWLPLMALVWARVLAAPSGWRALAWALLLGLCAWALILIDVQYALFTPFLLVPYGLVALWRAGRVARVRVMRVLARAMAALGLAGIVAASLLYAVGPLAPILAYDRTALAPTPVERAVTIDAPLCYFSRCEADVSLGYLILPLLALSVVVVLRGRRAPRRGALLWLLVALPPLLLTLGDATPLYPLLHAALGGMFRYPERFAPLFLLPALIFLVRVWSPVFAPQQPRSLHTWRWLAAPLLLLAVLADARVFRPLPVTPLPADYQTYRALAADARDYVVVDVPTGGMSGEGISGDSRWMQTQFYALAHGHRVTNGHISRVDTWHYMYTETADPMMAWLGSRRYLEPGAVMAQLAERIDQWPLGVLALHERWINPATLTEIAGFLNAQDGLLCPPTHEVVDLPDSGYDTVDGGLLAYRARWLGCPPALTGLDPLTLDWGAPDDVRQVGWGWYPPEPAGGLVWRWLGAPPYSGATTAARAAWQNRAALYVELPPGAYLLSADVQAFQRVRTLTVWANGRALGTRRRVEPGALQSLTFALPAGIIEAGARTEIVFEIDGTLSPLAAGVGEDTRTLGIALDALRFMPVSP